MSESVGLPFFENPKFFELLFARMAEGVVVQGQLGEIIHFNRAALGILGLSEDQLIGRTSMDPRWRATRADGSPFPGTEHPAMLALAHGKPLSDVIMGLALPSGQQKWISIHAEPLWMASEVSGKPDGVFTVFRDITDELNASSDVQRLFEVSMDVLGIANFDSKFVRLNPAATRIWGWAPEEMYHKNFLSFVHPDDVAQTEAAARAAFESGLPTTYFENRIRCKDGTYRTMSWLSHSDMQRRLSYFSARDVTEQRQNELTLLQNSKMSSLGEMAGSVAHEINNPLAIIQGYAEEIVEELEGKKQSQSEVAKAATTILDTAQRIDRIVRGLRSFAREGSQDPFENVLISQIIEDTLVLAQNRFAHHGIKLTIDGKFHAVELECRPAQISQVLLNLLNNAFDAVRGAQGPKESKWVRVQVIVDSRPGIVSFRVADGGPGVRTELRDRIFEPFFTTKGAGHGTGLGLSVVSGIVKAHQGEIYLDPSGPTCFVVNIPKKQTLKVGAYFSR